MNAPPPIPEALVEWLEGVFPDRLPAEQVDNGQLGLLIGRQQVIRKLRQALARQNRNILENV